MEEYLCLVYGEETQVNLPSQCFLFDLKAELNPHYKCSGVRIEETWRLWQKFLEDFGRYEEWLATSEKTAALPNSSGVLYTVAKEELKKFEVRSRQSSSEMLLSLTNVT